MLSVEENELMTDISPGTPMGNLVRRYWIPVMLSEELPEPDGNPMRVRLLCEDLVIFRDSSGRVGLLPERCPHRRASLYLGRNEDDGLRCIYHGWKFDITGRCVDMPNEPEVSTFKEKIRPSAYPCQEAAGVIWAYMGPRAEPPPLPHFEWMDMPAEQRQMAPFHRGCNWVQALEGDIDTSHSGFLHGVLERRADAVHTWRKEHPPLLDVVTTRYGMMYGGRYGDIDPGQSENGSPSTYWRVSNFLFPFYTFFPSRPNGLVPGHIWVPQDNHNTMVWTIGWNPVQALEQSGPWRARSGAMVGEYEPASADGMGRWRPKANWYNDYHQDRELQRTDTFTGIPTIPLQDQAVTETMGSITDRSHEHLGQSDAAIIRMRRRLLGAVKALRDDDVEPPCVDTPDWYHIRSASGTMPADADWIEELGDWMDARTLEIPGVGLPSPV